MTTQVEILQQLKHPNVIEFYGVVSDPRGIGDCIITGRYLCLIYYLMSGSQKSNLAWLHLVTWFSQEIFG